MLGAGQVLAMTEERKDALFGVLTHALKCDAASGYLRASLAEEREKLRDVWALAGLELGWAMFNGDIDGPKASKGRRCLTRFNYPPSPDMDEADVAFNVGFTLGQARECFAGAFMGELRAMGPDGLFDRIGDEDLHDDKQYVQQYARSYFTENGCKAVRMPD